MAAVLPGLLLTVLATSEAQLQFTGDSDSDISPCRDWKNEPDTILWNALLKGDIIVDYLAWRCKTTPQDGCKTQPTSCLHQVQFSSERYPLNFTHPVKGSIRSISAHSSDLKPFTPIRLGGAEANKALIIKWFRDGTFTSGCDCNRQGSSHPIS